VADKSLAGQVTIAQLYQLADALIEIYALVEILPSANPLAMTRSPFLKAMRTMRHARCRVAQDDLRRPIGGSVVSVCFCSYLLVVRCR
jgi:hypothetical protein